MAEGDADDRIDAQGFRLALRLRPQMICTSLIDEMVVALANSRSSSRFCSAYTTVFQNHTSLLSDTHEDRHSS